MALTGCGGNTAAPAGTTATAASEHTKTVPDVAGRNFGTAVNILNTEGFDGVAYGKDGKEWKSNFPADAKVLSSDPVAGTSTDTRNIRLNVDMNEADVIAKRAAAAAAKKAAEDAAAKKAADEAAAKKAAEAEAAKPKDYSGYGDDILTITKHGTGAEAVVINHNGGSNFAVQSLDANLKSTDLLVNEIGNYSGVVLLDGRSRSGETKSLKITAGGAWTISIVALTGVKSFDGSAPITGHGDDVFYYTGPVKAATFTHTGTSNIAVQTFGTRGDLLINEIGAYTGTVVWAPGLYQVTADGDWSAALK